MNIKTFGVIYDGRAVSADVDQVSIAVFLSAFCASSTPSFLFLPTVLMPYIDLQSKPDYASIFYTTNTTYRNISGFHPDKPTVVILHPLLLDSSWLCLQFGDPRLNDAYNLISFDMRSCGRSFCRLDARHDSWVDAADLALCFQVC